MSKMTAGRELDALVAEKVMGWERSIVGNYPWQLIPPGDDRFHVRMCPHYSTDIAAAWEVVEHVRDTTDGDETWVNLSDWGAEGWRCSIVYNLTSNDAPIILADEKADTVPLAICRAALAQTDAKEPAA